jgi:hypothetical protein
VWQRFLDILWVAVLVCLPLTSLPLFVDLTKGAVVCPLSALPIFVLFFVWFIPYLLQRGKIPKEGLPLFYFLMIAIAVSAGAFFIDIPAFKGKDIIGQEGRAFLTLAIGIAFYFVFATWPSNHDRLKKTLQWINVGGILMASWTLLQAYFILKNYNQYPDWMLNIQKLLVEQSPSLIVGNTRVTGLTYEPSWFAHQMVMLYLPLWLAATYERKSAFNFRLLRISVENILLVVGLIEFYLCSPRIALIAFIPMTVFLFAKFNLAVIRKLIQTITIRWFARQQKAANLLKGLVSAGIGVLLLAAYTGILIAVIYLGSQRDYRLARLINNPPTWQEITGIVTLKEDMLFYVSNRLIFLERISYWVTGWHIFNQHPWLGVGLGNAGLFFLDQMPASGWASYEIRTALTSLPQPPNIKSFWVRLLAETGLVGFSIFLAWFYILWRSIRLTGHSNEPILKILALAGQLSLIAFLAEGFSIDSFAMPYLWVSAGLISASGIIYRQTLHKGDD